MSSLQLSITLDPDTRAALAALAALEHRSVSKMAAILIEQRLTALRGEYRHHRALPSLPKASRTTTRGWTREYIDKFGA